MIQQVYGLSECSIATVHGPDRDGTPFVDEDRRVRVGGRLTAQDPTVPTESRRRASAPAPRRLAGTHGPAVRAALEIEFRSHVQSNQLTHGSQQVAGRHKTAKWR